MQNQDFFYLVFEKLFSGFGFSMLIVFVLSLFKSETIKEFSNKFIHYSIQVIRILGMAYFVYYLIRLFTLYSIDELFFSERATGEYAWSYWMMLLRPFIFCLLTQLFWFAKIKNSKKRGFVLTLIICFIVLASGKNLERFIIMLTAFHRDYEPSNGFSSEFEFTFIYFFLWFENSLLCSGAVFVTWFLSEKLTKTKWLKK